MNIETLRLFDEPSGPTGPLVRVALLIAYHGGRFRGLAPNAGVRTVVGELVLALRPYLGYDADVVMSGRTDAGVHAWGQVLHLDVPEPLADTDRIARIINVGLQPEIVCRGAVRVADDFSARHSATGRRYRFTVLNTPHPSPFLADTAWWVADPLDLASMRLACDPLLGEHDFSSFCRRPKGSSRAEAAGEANEVSLVRRVTGAQWRNLGDGRLEFSIEGSAFCHQMVRSIVGFHVAVGRGRRSAGELRGVMAARDRNAAVSPAPPHGLVLWSVDYPEHPFPDDGEARVALA